MRNIIRFFMQIRIALLFLLLEGIAVTFIVRQNVYHNAAFFNSSMEINARILEIRSDIISYFDLRNENKRLLEENAQLRAMLESSYIVTDKQIFEVNDTLYRQQFEFVTATVISYSNNQRNNYLTIDKGSDQGIEEGMGVYSPDGVIGVVDRCTKNYSLVRSFLHSSVQISTKVKRLGAVGTAAWDGNNFNYAYLNDIPLHVMVKPGDTLVTSRFSSIFPEGILLGYVENVNTDETKAFYKIRFRLSVDFSQLSGVYVIRNLIKEELEELQDVELEYNE
ncbi:MAG: rod shape-determining protein MreC [Marinilabiliales bacterium]|nr:MAG: rod shape-determining protein MreC [Marinilabiliales bacterium]